MFAVLALVAAVISLVFVAADRISAWVDRRRDLRRVPMSAVRRVVARLEAEQAQHPERQS